MPVKDCKTEHHIRETAKRIFFKEGKMRATTQDIADAAGVNRTLLHYYFRSRDALFTAVFQEAFQKLRQGLHAAIESQEPFRQKLESFINAYFDQLVEAPYLETFLVLQLAQDPGKYEELFIKMPGGEDRIQRFLAEIQSEMDKGTIPPMDPVQFYMSLFGLMAYPLLARPIYQNLFHLDDATFDRLYKERKKLILSLVFPERAPAPSGH
ncbi:TetR/AcrR family transcriptional regulator [Paraflavisolibacter sp. H34]|uniref:TetR/AcrR family transcriptional regulator n=1 Tax=Huijunlia imazamoxiresistens TaxID=3127457 RepID=UPI0030163412